MVKKMIRTAWLYAERLVLFITVVTALTASIGFMIELEDRQLERTSFAWRTLTDAVENNFDTVTIEHNCDDTEESRNCKRTTTMELCKKDNLSLPRTTEKTVYVRGSGVRDAFEYLNRDFPGRWCWSFVNSVSDYTTGNTKRSCVFPEKERVPFTGMCLSFLELPHLFLPNARLEGATLRYTNLSQSNLQGAYLFGSDMQNVTLHRANLQDAELGDAKLVAADLTGANLQGAKLMRVNFSEATMGCIADEENNVKCTDLRNVIGLNCEQLSKAKNWHKSFRNEELKCNKDIPQ